MVVQYVFIFFTHVIFLETLMEMDFKTVDVMLKNKLTTIFHGLHSLQ